MRSRYHSSLIATAAGHIPQFPAIWFTPTRNCTTKIATQTPIRVSVTELEVVSLPPKAVRGSRTAACPAATQSGHWKPTDAGTMHSGQIGRSQRVQLIQVGRSGCR